jgi:hypothetical protein
MIKQLLIISAISFLCSCTATSTLISKRDLDVQTKTSNAIFVEPVVKSARTVFLEVRSGVQEFDRHQFVQFINNEFSQNPGGYRLVDDPEAAQFHMQAFVLNLEKASESAAKQALGQGYLGGAVLTGAAVGAAIDHNNRFRGAGVGGLAAGAADFIAGAVVKDVYYMLVVDLQVSEKTAQDRQAYQTRIVTTANKANLKLEDAAEPMFQKTAFAISSFF